MSPHIEPTFSNLPISIKLNLIYTLPSFLNSTIILDEEPATTEGNNVEDEYEYDEENDYEGVNNEEGTQEGTEEGAKEGKVIRI